MMQIPESAEHYLAIQRTDFDTPEKRLGQIQSDYERIAEYLPPMMGKQPRLVEVGCGAGFLAAMLAKHFKSLVLVDGTGDSKNRSGMNDNFAPFNDLDVTREVLRSNGVDLRSVKFLPVGTEEFPEADLVISTLSWCWHYPARAYLDAVRLREGGRLIVDIRDSHKEVTEAAIGARFQKIGSIQRVSGRGERVVYAPNG